MQRLEAIRDQGVGTTSESSRRQILRELPLCLNEVHVWCALLDLAPWQLKRLAETLTLDERARAEKFRSSKDQSHFIAARGVLRDILSRYLNKHPAQLRFCYGQFGKPLLATEDNAIDIRFNLSHSEGMALLAFTRMRSIGADVERVKSDVTDDMIAERFFSASEAFILRNVLLHSRPEAFLRFWTGKEAYLKGRGEGLRVPLDSFDVSPLAEKSSCVFRDEKSHWSLLTLKPTPDYIAAVAIEGRDWKVCRWQWRPESFAPNHTQRELMATNY